MSERLKRREERARKIIENLFGEPMLSPQQSVEMIISDLAAIEQELVKEMMEPSEGMLKAGREAVSLCYSLEPGEGFDEPPAPAAFEAMLRAFCAENAIPVPGEEGE